MSLLHTWGHKEAEIPRLPKREEALKSIQFAFESVSESAERIDPLGNDYNQTVIVLWEMLSLEEHAPHGGLSTEDAPSALNFLYKVISLDIIDMFVAHYGVHRFS